MVYHYRIALTLSASLGALVLGAAPAIAQSTPEQPAEPSRDHDDFHDNVIVVTAGGLQRLDMLAGTSVLEGEDLQRNLDGQIGEVLTRVPGVSATSFSPSNRSATNWPARSPSPKSTLRISPKSAAATPCAASRP